MIFFYPLVRKIGPDAVLFETTVTANSINKQLFVISYFTSSGYSVDNTPRSSVPVSPTVNLSREYTLAIHTNSYSEIRRIFDHEISVDQTLDIEHVESFGETKLLEQFLQPSHERVQEALSLITLNSLVSLVGAYFEHTENTSRLCLLLFQSVRRARLLYNPIYNILDDLPIEFDSDTYSLSLSRCNSAFNAFLQFDLPDNPFLAPDSGNFEDTRQCFSQLRRQLDNRLKESKSKVQLIRRCSIGSALCLTVVAVGVTISAVAIPIHALVALVGIPICPPLRPSNMTKREMIHLAQLNAAAKGAYVLHHDLNTIDRLVARLHAAVEDDKILIRMGLERGIDRYLIQEILKQLQRNRPSFDQQLAGLKEHLFLCLAAINRARSLLLEEILVHQNREWLQNV